MIAPEASVNLVAAALQYAARGWAVFPLHSAPGGRCTCSNVACQSVGKHPRTRRGLHDASTDEKVIRSWWRTWPDANIGIATGPRSGFWALDIDDGGEETLDVMVHELGELPPTIEAQTGSGGRHLLFQYTEDVHNTSRKLGDGLDTRGDGGYIVAAPSLHSTGNLYSWIHQHGPGDLPIAVAPEWLLDRLREPAYEQPAPVRAPEGLHDVQYARGALRNATHIMLSAAEGSRNETLNKQAYSLFGFVASGLLAAGEVEAVLSDAALAVGLPFQEVQRTIQSARSGEKRPRGAPERRRPGPAFAPAPAAQAEADDLTVGVADFFATCDEKIEWLVEPFIAKGTFTLIQGAPKSGKTFFVSWLSATLAATGRKVIFVEEEGAKEMLRDRLEPFLQPDPRVFNDNLRIIFRKNVKLDVDSSVRALIEACKGADVLVLDPFASLHHADENDAAELGIVIQAIQRLITAIPGLSVILIHHTKKGASWDKTDASAASSADARGSGATVGAADQIISIKSVAATERVAGQVRCYVENTDTRIGAPFEKRLAIILLTGGVGSLEWSSATDAAAEEERQAELIERIRLVLKPAPDFIGQKELRKALGVKLDRLRSAIFAGVERQLFIQTKLGVALV